MLLIIFSLHFLVQVDLCTMYIHVAQHTFNFTIQRQIENDFYYLNKKNYTAK